MKTEREYQNKARIWVNRQLNQKNNPLLVMPAGSGKTVTACNIIKDRILLKKKIIVLCGTEEIFDQWIKECSLNEINYGYINPEGIIGKNKSVYICMWQSLSNMLTFIPEKFCKSFNEIITDETHHSGSPTLESIYDHFSQCLRVGLTATPYRMDNRPLGKYYNVMYEPIKQTEAINKNFLCRPYIIIPDEYKNYVPASDNIENINKSEQRKLIKDKKIIGDMVGLYRDVFNGALCMIPCSSVEHAGIVAEMYRAEGWKVEHLSGTMNKNDRRRIIRHARHDKINIITTYDVGSEGLDIPNIAGVIWMRLTGSLVKWIQINTRAARKHGKKKFYILVDPVGNSVIHGRPDIDRKWSLDTDYVPGQDVDPELPEMSICPVCGTSNSRENIKCWVCKYDFSTGMLDGVLIEKNKRRMPKFVDGELVFLDDENIIYGDENEHRIQNNNNNNADNHNDISHNNNVTELTKAQKIEILKRDLTGLRHKTAFREGIKYL